MNKRISAAAMAAVMGASVVSAIPVQATGGQTENDTIVLRVCNWEEYIDEGGWEDDEVIDLDSGDIFGENSMIQDFEEWYQDTYGKKVRVEYSTFGTNEELYSQLNLGNVYDLVCPSDYMIMKLLKENKLEPLSKDFFDTENENNYYVKGVSPYINGVFEENQIDGKPWVDYAAGYMWGITGMVYNPEEVTEEEASTWTILENPTQELITIAISMLFTPCPRSPATAIISVKPGSPWKMLEIVVMIPSIQPPKYPAKSPSAKPSSIERTVAARARRIDCLPP